MSLGPVVDDAPGAEVELDVSPELRLARRRLLVQILRPYRAAVAVAALCILVSTAAQVGMPLAVKAGIDHGVGHRNRGALVFWVVAFLVAAVTDAVAQRLAHARGRPTPQRAIYSLPTPLPAHLQGLSPE